MANRPKKSRSKTGIRARIKKMTWLEIIQKAILALFVLFILGGASLLIAYHYVGKDLPALAGMDDYLQKTALTTKVYDIHGKIIGEFFIERRIPVPSEDIPGMFRNAVISIEDKRYFQHKGVDYIGILRAFYVDIREMDLTQGASTITMQVARSFYLTREKSFARKFKEAILAYKIERTFTKDDIVTIYMNQIYLGHGAYGIGAAADEYFGKTVDKLTLGETALLAGLPKNPGRFDPYRNPKDALDRRNLVLGEMLTQGMITQQQADAAKAEKLNLVARVDPTRNTAPYFTEHVRKYLKAQYGDTMVYEGGLQVFTTLDGEWNKAAQKSLRWGLRRLDRQLGFRGPDKHLEGDELKQYIENNKNAYSHPPDVGDVVEAVVATVPKTAEVYATVRIGQYTGRMSTSEWAWAKNLNEKPYNKAKIGLKPRSNLEPGDIVQVDIMSANADGTLVVGLEQKVLVQGALISIDPYTGEVRAMVGGYDFEESEFNRAMQAKRQSGSAFKPIIYTAAIESGYTPATVVNDAPLMFEGWKPENFGGKFSGPQTLAYALQRSINTISIKLSMDMGVGRVIQFARDMGIESDLPRELTISLGSATLSLLELTRAYGVLASEGKLVQPIFVRRVYDRDGKLLEDRVPRVEGFGAPPEDAVSFRKWLAAGKEPAWGPVGYAFRKSISENRGRQVLDPKTVCVVISMMRRVVEAGTGMNARLPGIEVAGKTGTTNNYRDSLFVGFTTQLLTGVWVGYDNFHISLGDKSTGGDVAAPIWQRYMRTALEGHVIPAFPCPDGIVTYTFDLLTGTYPAPDAAHVGAAAFKDGTQPAPYVPPASDGQDFLQEDLKNQGQETLPTDPPPGSDQPPQELPPPDQSP